MKDLTKYLAEGIVSESQSVVAKAQYDYSMKSGAYETYSYSQARRKYKKGFLLIDENEDFYSVTVFNSAKEYAEQMGMDSDAYMELESMRPGEESRVDVAGQDLWAIRLW